MWQSDQPRDWVNDESVHQPFIDITLNDVNSIHDAKILYIGSTNCTLETNLRSTLPSRELCWSKELSCFSSMFAASPNPLSFEASMVPFSVPRWGLLGLLPVLELPLRPCLPISLTCLKLAGRNVRMRRSEPQALTARTKHLHFVQGTLFFCIFLPLWSSPDVDWIRSSMLHSSTGKGSGMSFLFRFCRCCVNRKELKSVSVTSRSFKRSMLSRSSLNSFSFGESILTTEPEWWKIFK